MINWNQLSVVFAFENVQEQQTLYFQGLVWLGCEGEGGEEDICIVFS